ncbi:hypothetical protein BJP25_10830 [Actinokineospora bangkokensis]|uniref:NADH dehydrogenase n=1 Tax=Actinokineospora bangkokensis TaxID=1193682 RepID=A0A1Q9LRS1_9PSEU|nr:hypothetical protein BJP25_10830 [Actinokineospora bangkokensis]
MLATATPDLAAHAAVHGPLPRPRPDDLLAAVDAAGLRGRGGGGFPTGRKLRAVAAGRRPVVVANGCEGDPASAKDKALLATAPHLVLDGVELAAHAVGAREAILCAHDGTALRQAVAARALSIAVSVVDVPRRYVASEETSLVNFLNTGDARPLVKLVRPAERGVRGRPTLVDNVETLAQLALLARTGPEAFRRDETRLSTVLGAAAHGGVFEVPAAATVGDLLRMAGADPEGPVLAGGLGGEWLVRAGHLRVADVPGVSAFRVLGGCGVRETAHVLGYLAGESARQCGPCAFGLPAIAADLAALAAGGAPAEVVARLRRRLGVIPGRGACAHPDGAVRLAASALRVFSDDIAAHAHGRCLA